jgi:hypothetical protein
VSVSIRLHLEQLGRLTTTGTVNKSVTVAVGCTILQEQAVARPCSADILLGLFVVEVASVEAGVPLAMTESTIAEAIDSI